jgi:hypothetical protein
MYDGSHSAGDRPPKPSVTAVRLGPVVVYTAITRGYDILKEQPRATTKEASFVAFLDEPWESETWRSLPVHTALSDPNRNAKIHKILSHVYLPDAEYTLWIDGSVTIQPVDSIQRLIDVYLADCDLAVFRHRLRTCVYQEANVCLQRRLDEPEVIWQQACRYTREGYPANAGLAECSVILRRHTSRVRAFNEAWWDEIATGSRRDQLSFGYVAQKVALRYGFFPGSIADNPWFHRGAHAECREEPAAGVSPRLGEPTPPLAEAGRATAPACAGPSTDSLEIVTQPRFYRSSPLPRGRTVGLGRVRDKPSWGWAGFDVARELSKDYGVVLYDSSSRPPRCDVLFMVKKRPFETFVSEALRNGTKLVYCPIDDYDHPEQIVSDAEFLRACAMAVVHCERLIPLLRPYCANVHFVEHHARHALHDMVEYKESGYILWVGAFQYVPYLVSWLERHPIDREIRILSNPENENARTLALSHAEEIGLQIEISPDATSIAGHRIYRWSERRQQDMMRGCKAALDVKMTRFFSQYHKPPTKAQQYVASGIPFAVNPDSYSAEYFRARGFDVASPLDIDLWLSREYWGATRSAGERLRAVTSIETVTARYRDLIESL